METSKGELVPGGLAMVYGLVVYVDLNGIVVRLDRWVGEYEAFNSPITGDRMMYVGAGGWLCFGEIPDTEHKEESGMAVFEPRNLMPINPEADPLAVEEEQCQTA